MTQTPDQWAEIILSKPMGLGDDYGNLILSFGGTEAYKQEDVHPISHHTQTDITPMPLDNRSANQTIHHPSSTKTKPFGNKVKPACTPCHARKVRCDLVLKLDPTTGARTHTPCTNCRKVGRESDCRRHRRKPRRESSPPVTPADQASKKGELDLSTLLASAGGGRGAGVESEGERLKRLGEELRRLGESLMARASEGDGGGGGGGGGGGAANEGNDTAMSKV